MRWKGEEGGEDLGALSAVSLWLHYPDAGRQALRTTKPVQPTTTAEMDCSDILIS